MNRQALTRTFTKTIERLGLESAAGITFGKEASRAMMQLTDGCKEITYHVKPNIFAQIQREQVTATPVTRQKGDDVLYFNDAKFINTWPGDEKIVVLKGRGDVTVMTVSALH